MRRRRRRTEVRIQSSAKIYVECWLSTGLKFEQTKIKEKKRPEMGHLKEQKRRERIRTKTE